MCNIIQDAHDRREDGMDGRGWVFNRLIDGGTYYKNVCSKGAIYQRGRLIESGSLVEEIRSHYLKSLNVENMEHYFKLLQCLVQFKQSVCFLSFQQLFSFNLEQIQLYLDGPWCSGYSTIVHNSHSTKLNPIVSSQSQILLTMC